MYSNICHFSYTCRISIYKNANISREMWNILEAFTVLKKICWHLSRKWVLEKTHCLCLVLCLRASVVVPLQEWCVSFVLVFVILLFVFVFAFVCICLTLLASVVVPLGRWWVWFVVIATTATLKFTLKESIKNHKNFKYGFSKSCFCMNEMGTHIFTQQVTSP